MPQIAEPDAVRSVAPTTPTALPVPPDLLIRYITTGGAHVDVTGHGKHSEQNRWSCQGCGDGSERPDQDYLWRIRRDAGLHAESCRAVSLQQRAQADTDGTARPALDPVVGQRLDQALTAVQGEIARVDTKVAVLLAVDTAGLAGVAALSAGHPLALITAVPAALALGAAAVLGIMAVRPHLGGAHTGSWPHWATLDSDDALLDTLRTETRPANIRVLARLNRRKCLWLRRSCLLRLVALPLLGLTALIPLLAH